MTDQYSEFRDAERPGEAVFAQLNSLVDAQLAAEQSVADLEEQLKKAKGKVVGISEHDIPDLMEEMGLSEFRTVSGLRVKIKEAIYANTSPSKDPERHAAAMKWLEDHNHGGLIKRLISVGFNRDQEDAAAALCEKLEGEEYNVNKTNSVHPSSLRSWVNKMLEAGEDIPMDLFGVTKRRTSKIG